MNTDSVTLLLIHGREPSAHRLAPYLTAHGVRVTAVVDATVRELDGEADGYDCVVVDLGRDIANAVVLTRAVRARSEVPILLISQESEVAERVAAFDAGADDWVATDCGERELLARILASVRRARRFRSPG